MNAWFVAMTILLGVGARILHRYDVRRVLIWIAFVWFVPGALLLGYRSEHLCVIGLTCRLQARLRGHFAPMSQRLLPSIWRHRNVQRRKRHQLWPFG